MLFLALYACQSNTEPTDGSPTDADTDSGPAETGRAPEETGGTTTTNDTAATGDTTLDLACEPTDNPLRYGCTVHVTPARAVEVTFHRTDGLSVERTVHSASASDHTVPIYLLAPEREYELTARAGGAEVTTTFTTAAVPQGVDVHLEATGVSGIQWIGSKNPCNGAATAVIFDASTGEIVWYDNLVSPGNFSKLDMFRFTPDGTVLGETGEDIVEIDMMGNEIAHLVGIRTLLGAGDTFWGLHHDVFSRNGLYYVMYHRSYPGHGASDLLDVVTLLDATGTVVTEFDPIEHVELAAGWFGDWLHTNSIWVDENQDMILSWAARDAVAKIEGDPASPDFGDVLWVMDSKNPDTFGSAPPIGVDWGPATEGFANEHDMGFTPDGRLSLLDNGHGRGMVITPRSTPPTPPTSSIAPSRARCRCRAMVTCWSAA